MVHYARILVFLLVKQNFRVYYKGYSDTKGSLKMILAEDQAMFYKEQIDKLIGELDVSMHDLASNIGYHWIDLVDEKDQDLVDTVVARMNNSRKLYYELQLFWLRLQDQRKSLLEAVDEMDD